MRMWRSALLALLAALTFPGGADEDVYFSLSSNRTFGLEDRPAVHLWGQGVGGLQFRVYRVRDPVAFFEQLEDPQHFGGRARRPPRRLTPLERFRLWKRRLRARLRDVARSQFDGEQRAVIRDWLAARRRQAVRGKAPAADRFATVPLLNPEQLVAVWQQRFASRRGWVSEEVRIPVRQKGLYLVEATDGNLQAYTIVSVTDLALLVKGAPGKLAGRLLWRSSGTPAGETPVLVRAPGGPTITANTRKDGCFELDLASEQRETVLVMARQGEDFAAATMGGWHLVSDPGRYSQVYLYTDRPVYRPGHTVHFRGIVRVETPAGYQVPQQREVSLEIQDPDYKPLLRRTLPVSPLGTFHGQFTLPPHAALGHYVIWGRTPGERFSEVFYVEEYKKPEYEVRLTPAVRRVIQGRPIQVLIEARYYYGEPVSQGKVRYAVHRLPYWPPYYLDEPEPGEEEERHTFWFGAEQVLEGSGALDAQGRLNIEVPTELWLHDTRYRITARVTDPAGREIEGAASVPATIGSYFLSLEPERYVYAPGEPAGVVVEARDYDNNPVAGVAVRVEASRWRKDQSAGPVEAVAEGRTDAGGRVTLAIPLPSAGSYLLKAKSVTPENREVESSRYVWATGRMAEYGLPGGRVEIVPDKKSYNPGDIAKVLIVTGQPQAELWVTTEGHRVYSSQTISAAESAITVEIPIRPEYAPNFFVRAAFLRGGGLYEGSKNIRVSTADKQLNVEITTPKTEFRPGESGAYVIQARDSAGRPVANAEFSLGVVDEAVYAVRPESAQDIMRFFWGRRYNRVHTGSSLSYYFYGEAGRRRMPLVEFRKPGALAQLKPPKLVQPQIRKAFPDTIHWVADLRTDAEGRAETRLSFPDALTTWRATARGVTADTKVGSAINKVVVRKNLILRLAAPRFFTQGDEVVIPAIVHNYLPAAKRVRVSLEVRGLELVEGRTTEVEVASRDQAPVNFRVRAHTPGEAVLLAKALTDEESDALELTLPVRPYGVRMAQARAGSLSQLTGEAQVELAFPADATPETRTITVEVAPSLAGALLGALEYLTSFPYGCTEQTVSSLLPNVIVAQAVRQLGLRSAVDQAALDRKVREGLNRLADFQHNDGGWGWWKSDESDVFMTAYALTGLAQARAAGYQLNLGVIHNGLNWLDAQWPQLARTPGDLQAYVLYAMAVAGAHGPVIQSRWEELWRKRRELSPYGLALLGLAVEQAADPRAAAVASELESAARGDEQEAYWPVARDDLLGIADEATVEATAYALKLLTAQRPQSPLLPKAALYLLNHRDQGAWWGSTKRTAMAVYGLTDYLRKGGELRPNFSVKVWVNEGPVLERRFSEAEALSAEPLRLRLPAARLQPGPNRIRIAKSGEGRLYWSARAEYYSTAERLMRTGTVSLNLLREYFRLAPRQEGGRIRYRLEPLGETASRGDLIAVRLTLSGGDWRYLVMEDPIPAGAEFIERDELYELEEKPWWWASWHTRREFHDDRAALFLNWFRAGQGQYFYLLKLVNAGRFRLGPARVEPMYQPGRLATTEGRLLEVR